MSEEFDEHKIIYDIIDNGSKVRRETIKLSRLIDPTFSIPNTLQAVLGMIFRYEGTTQSQLSEIYNNDSKNIIKYVTELTNRGYVKKVKDKKLKRLYLTEEGKALNEHFMIERGRLIDYLLDSVPESELDITRKTLIRLVDLMEGYNEDLNETTMGGFNEY